MLWDEFFQEVKRFDSKKLISIFNDDVPVRNIPENKIELTGRDKLLIGEFIRRYHARIAHEIAFNGVPGLSENAISLPVEPDANFLDLCGYIARSHNMGLRSAVDKLERNKKQVHLNCHVPFIMLVLRISDYIQVHSQRAPRQLLNIKSLISPISRGEWEKHHSIVEIHNAHDDPEAIYIDAEPKSALTYESLVILFKDMQRELDLSWSVLGEVYGRYEHLKVLGINIRRIRSSLDSLEEFIESKKPDYLPKVLRFQTADSEMMELLISPLYGDKPEVGVRELLQNSIDACVELDDLMVKNNSSSENNLNHDVVITLVDNPKGGGELIIEDFGIGMTLEVIENYFLNIGASFRNSDRWKKEHETDGHSNVYRTGRFGIGLLAAYLLGDEIKVETRHIYEDPSKGLAFNCKKGSDSIVLTNIATHVGTKISIFITDSVKSALMLNAEEWDWFSLSTPKVVRKIITKEGESILEQSKLVPSSGEPLKNKGWSRILVNGYDDVLWSYEKIGKHSQYYIRDSKLICNGILITDRLYLDEFEISSKIGSIEADTPSIVVFDQDGRLPINLERSNLVGRKLPFHKELSQDLSDYLAKKMIKYLKSLNFLFSKELLEALLNISIEGLSDGRPGYSDNVCRFIVSNDSILPMDYDLIKKRNIKNLLIDGANLGQSQGAWSSEEFKCHCDNYLIVDKVTKTKQSRSSWVRSFFELNIIGYGRYRGIKCLPIVGRRILLRKSDIVEIVTPGYVPKTFWNRLSVDWENDKWRMLSIGRNTPFEADLTILTAQLESSGSFGVIFCTLEWEDRVERDGNDKESPFSISWLKENNQKVVFDLEGI